MPSNVRWKFITILCVLVIFAAVGVYPIAASRYHWPFRPIAANKW